MKLGLKIGLLFGICASFVVMSACMGGKKEGDAKVDCKDSANAEKTECKVTGTATVNGNTVNGNVTTSSNNSHGEDKDSTTK